MRARIIVALVFAAATCGCGRGQSTATTVSPPPPAATKAKPLIIGTSRTYPPIIFTHSGETIGLEADFARALGEELGRPVELRPMLFSDLMEEITYDRVDMVMAGLSITDERAKVAHFTRPYLVTGQQAMVRYADRGGFATHEAVLTTDRRVGVERGTTAAEFARANLRKARVFEYDTVGEAISALTTRHIDLVIHDAPSVQWVLRTRGDRSLFAVPGLLTEERLAWAVRKDDAQLFKRVGEVLERWRASGQLQAMIDKWVVADRQ